MTEPKTHNPAPALRKVQQAQGLTGFAHSGERSYERGESGHSGQTTFMEKATKEPFPASGRLRKNSSPSKGAALEYKQPYVGCIDGWDATGVLTGGIGLGPILGTNMFGAPDRGMGQALASQIGARTIGVVRRVQYNELLAGIENAHAEARPIVIFAHSMANNQVVEDLAKELAAKGIRINVFVMCDASYLDEKYLFQPGSREVPANVDHVICLTSDGPFQGKPISRDLLMSPATTYEKHTLSSVFGRKVSHEDYNDPEITRWISNRVKDVLTSQARKHSPQPNPHKALVRVF